jgi:RNA-binding protein
MINSGMKHRLKRKLGTEKTFVHVGKEGLTQRIIGEFGRQLEQREVIKAKILKTALKEVESREIATKIAVQTGSVLIELRGHTFILYKKRKRLQAAKTSK